MVITQEMNDNDNNYWFFRNYKKNLHNIDTFYYSAFLSNDFSVNSEDIAYKEFLKYLNKIKIEFNESVSLNILEQEILFKKMNFSKYYKYTFSLPDKFDIIFAACIPTQETPQVIIQIRSNLLWEKGIKKAFDYSFKILSLICDFFKFDILTCQENRIDYCWHTNIIQDPDNYFRIDNMVKMRVTTLGKRIKYEYSVTGEEYENDYIAQGKRGGKVFLRIYLKTKEVVEMGYKGFFLKEWLLNNLINRYDFYCLEKALINRSWSYVDKARLEFYLEFGKNENEKIKIRSILNDTYKINNVDLKKYADTLTPSITKILNIEFQTMRKMSKSFCLQEFIQNEKYDCCQRIYDYIDNRKRIVEYLTFDTFRLVDIKTDKNKSRCEINDFWKRIRRTKLVDCKNKEQTKLIRDYSSKLNSEIIKRTALHSCITYSLYKKGYNEDRVIDDVCFAILNLNDNDIHKMNQYKNKKMRLLNLEKSEFNEILAMQN